MAKKPSKVHFDSEVLHTDYEDFKRKLINADKKLRERCKEDYFGQASHQFYSYYETKSNLYFTFWLSAIKPGAYFREDHCDHFVKAIDDAKSWDFSYRIFEKLKFLTPEDAIKCFNDDYPSNWPEKRPLCAPTLKDLLKEFEEVRRFGKKSAQVYEW